MKWWVAGVVACLAFVRPALAADKVQPGYIVLEIEPVTEMVQPDARLTVTIGAFTLDDQTFHTSAFGGWETVKVKVRDPSRQTYRIEAAPGTYVVQKVSLGRWSVCFNKGTSLFTVKSGEATHIGRLDLKQALSSLRDAVAAGVVPKETKGEEILFDETLNLSPGNDPQASLSPTTFDTGLIKLIVTQKTCGVTAIMRRRAMN